MAREQQPASTPIAYDYDGAAAAIGRSARDVIKRAVAKGDLTPRYPDSFPIILHKELEAWAESLPVEKPGANS